MNKENINKTIQLIIIIILGSIVLYFVCIYLAKLGYRERNRPNQIEIIGKLTRKSHGKTSYTEFEYSYEGTTYKEQSSASSIHGEKTVLGEKYYLRVDPKDPAHYTIVVSKPVFTTDEQIDSTVGRLISVWEDEMFTIKNRGVTFTYMVDGYEYERDQEISTDDTNFSRISEGNCYIIKYWLEDPQRAIFYTDAPSINCD